MSAATLLYQVSCHGTTSDSTIAFVLQLDIVECYYLRGMAFYGVW
jgi:hypothetical protein